MQLADDISPLPPAKGQANVCGRLRMKPELNRQHILLAARQRASLLITAFRLMNGDRPIIMLVVESPSSGRLIVGRHVGTISPIPFSALRRSRELGGIAPLHMSAPRFQCCCQQVSVHSGASKSRLAPVPDRYIWCTAEAYLRDSPSGIRRVVRQ